MKIINYNRMKNKINLFLIVLALFSNACSKNILDIKPEQNVFISEAIVSVPTMRTALNGVYSILQSPDYYGRTMVVLPDLMSDNMYQSIITGARYTNYDRYAVTVSDANATDTWVKIYSAVINANAIIEKGTIIQNSVPTAEVAEAKQLLGETYALRALSFFDLCRLYAKPYNYTTDASHLGIPLPLTYPKSKEDISYPSRKSVHDVYLQIQADLDSAISLLPTDGAVINGTSTSRINCWAVYALKSRVCLYKEDWENAEMYASMVINSNKYTLIPTTSFVTDFKKQLNTESIFEVSNSDKDNAGTDGVAYLYSQLGYGEMLASSNLYADYSSTDVRINFMSKGNRNASGGETNVNLINKYSGNTVNYNENIKVIRLAEMYLNRAEARARLGVDNAGAQADLQLIRKRGNPAALNVISTGSALIDLIIKERRREFAFEGYRLFDLLRTNTNFSKYGSAGAVISVNWNANKVTLPIPQREITVNPNLVQNPGY